MTDENYWGGNMQQSKGPEPPVRGFDSQPTQAIQSGFTASMSAAGEDRADVEAVEAASDAESVQQAAAAEEGAPQTDGLQTDYPQSQPPFQQSQPQPQQVWQGSPVAPVAAQAPSSGQAAEANAKKPASAGKTFAAGFLGALLACGLCIGGWSAYAGSQGTQQVSQTVVGSTDQSIINADDEGQSLAVAVAAKALPSVVAVYNYQQVNYGYGYGYGRGSMGGSSDDGSLVQYGMGSGVVISDDGYIITNYHVVEDAAKLTVTVDGKERDATYVGGDKSSDIAVVKVEDAEGLVPADIGDSDSLVIGEWVMTVGAPLGLEQSVATGVVSATNRSTILDNSSSSDYYSYYFSNTTPEYTYYPNMIQTDAVINPGNSGGALVDSDGKLIGINAMLSSNSGDYAGVGFAIPINYAIGIAEDVIAGKEPTHAILGVSISQVNAQIAQRYNLSASSGAYISAITPGTGAADSDLAVGDIITAVDGKAITSTTDVTLDVREHQVGDTITVTVNRDGEEIDIEVTLGSDENMQASSDDSGFGQQQDQMQQRDQQQYGNGGRGNGWGSDELEMLEDLLEYLNR